MIKKILMALGLALILPVLVSAQSGSLFKSHDYGVLNDGTSDTDSSWILDFGDYSKCLVEVEVDTATGTGDSTNALVIVQGCVSSALNKWNPLDTVTIKDVAPALNNLAWMDCSTTAAPYNKLRFKVQNASAAANDNPIHIVLRVKMKP